MNTILFLHQKPANKIALNTIIKIYGIIVAIPVMLTVEIVPLQFPRHVKIVEMIIIFS